MPILENQYKKRNNRQDIIIMICLNKIVYKNFKTIGDKSEFI